MDTATGDGARVLGQEHAGCLEDCGVPQEPQKFCGMCLTCSRPVEHMCLSPERGVEIRSGGHKVEQEEQEEQEEQSREGGEALQSRE